MSSLPQAPPHASRAARSRALTLLVIVALTGLPLLTTGSTLVGDAQAAAFANGLQRPPGGQTPGEVASIAEKTAGMEKIDGFFPLYWDADTGKLWMEISRFDTEVLHIGGLAAGLGSNDIGLDRGQLGGSRIVCFHRVGPKVLMVQPNYRFRSSSDNAAEVKAVTDAFAESTLWGFTVAAETDGTVLVDLTEFMLRDTHNVTPRLRPGNYRVDTSRSAIHRPMVMGFPENTELEAIVTFARVPGSGGGGGFGGGGGSFEGVGSVAASADAVTLRLHQSFVELPDDNYEPRPYDPRSGYFGITYRDYSVPLGEPMVKRFISRHRLEKVDPSAEISDPVEPIIYYLDPGAPEPIRSALLEGARWWNQAFEAAGYRNAFQVEMLPEDASPLDVRYNVINWVHRSTRGWSYGGTVTDPRTGEIIKGHVTLGSLRVRQDYMIAEGLLSPYEDGTETPPELSEWALARIRQLSAHEVGHTIGLGHNYYDSEQGRISVMDYPHPLVTLRDDGTFDTSEVYDVGIGEWDQVTIAYGYQDFPEGTDVKASLTALLDEAWDVDVLYLSNQDMSANPRVDQWSNGTNAAAELNRMMQVRRVGLDRFGERAIKLGRPLATMEEVLVPLYLHHRYQVEAAASTLGGIYYIYSLRGDGRDPVSPVPADEQWAAFEALMNTMSLEELALPGDLLEILPPRPSGFGPHRELFPRYTGSMFDAISPATVAAGHTISNMLDPARAARMVEQNALDPSLPSFDEVLARLIHEVFTAQPDNNYEAEISRSVERVLIDRLMLLAASAPMPQVRATTTYYLGQLASQLRAEVESAAAGDAAHYDLIARDVDRFLSRPAEPYTQPADQVIPPGAPIGQPAMDWLHILEPECSHFHQHWQR
jgi:hypothetical protein